jgi:phosphoribosylformylglycinamidine synthase
VRHRALPRRGDGHGRPAARRARHGARRDARRRHLLLLHGCAAARIAAAPAAAAAAALLHAPALSAGNLRIPGYELPWEDAGFAYPETMARPLQIMVDASSGASDYGNKFGEPVVCGFARTFGMRLPNGERREWVKPIMFSAGLGQIPACASEKFRPEPGMWVVKLGGPAYRIGMGGGAASSRTQDKAQARAP